MRVVNVAPLPLLARPRLAARAAVLLSVLAVALWVAVAASVPLGWVQSIDDRWRNEMADNPSEFLLVLARSLAVVGSAWVTVTLALVVALVLWRTKARTRLRVWATALIPSYAVTLTGKVLYARPRPDDRLLEVPTASFPSAHATDAAVLALALVLIFVPPGPRRRGWIVLAVAWALLMAWSRTYLRVHWLSDVSAGFLWGTACALWGTVLASRAAGTSPARSS